MRSETRGGGFARALLLSRSWRCVLHKARASLAAHHLIPGHCRAIDAAQSLGFALTGFCAETGILAVSYGAAHEGNVAHKKGASDDIAAPCVCHPDM
jgi:hypothetical protein